MPGKSRSPLLVIAAVAVGWIGWIGHPLAFGIAVLFPALWAASANRWTAALLSGGYFLAASRGLPLGVAYFYETDMWLGFLLWLVAAAGFVLVHTLLWTADRGWRRPVRFLLTMMVMAVPPFGIAGWAHPITAAGALFPGWGWVGVAATVAILVAMTTRWVWLGSGTAAIAFVVSAATYHPVQSLPGWRGLDTTVGGSSVVRPFLDPDKQKELLGQVKAPVRDGARVVVLPESAAGIWTPTTGRVWRDAAGDATLLVGATRLKPDGYDNVMVAVTGDGDAVAYSQRMPIPVSMWRPWTGWFGRPAGASASFVGDPVVAISGKRIAILICYEQLLVWPVLQSFWHDPEILVGTGNGWWTEGTSIVPIQQATAKAWARLFGVPVVTAFNR
ncbi:MAG: conjugal transfer protein TraB [Rhizobiaceae bacterium]